MLKFKNNHIFTGYLKQLLHDFNLPKYRIYTREQQEYFDKNNRELNVIDSVPISLEDIHIKELNKKNFDEHLRYIPYIKDNRIQIHFKNKWIPRDNQFYIYGHKYLNYTKNLQIDNNIYDTYTHEYLGEFLRFQRDYNNIDLMQLYNCFSNNLINGSDLRKSIKIDNFYYEKFTETAETVKNIIDSEGKMNFKIILPIGSTLTDLSNFIIDVDSVDIIKGVTTGKTAKLPVKIPFYLFSSTSLTGINSIQSQENTDGTKSIYLFDNKGTAYEVAVKDKTSVLCATFNLTNKSVVDKFLKTFKNFLYTSVAMTKEITFDTMDTKFKIYAVPVKFFKEYTIAIDCNQPVEFCCGIYGKYFDQRNKFTELLTNTYFKANKLAFSNPIIYDKIKSIGGTALYENELINNECDLRLFIKIPANNNSSITILEGNYVGYNDVIKIRDNLKINHSIINFENEEILGDIKLKSPLQLLKANTGESYPFADRLIEYLIGNAITEQEEIGDNVVRIQKILASPKNTDYQETFEDSIEGLFSDKIKCALYKFASNDKIFLNNCFTDTLGYCDKDIEKYFSANVKQADGTYKNTTIANIDIYTEIYDNIYNEE